MFNPTSAKRLAATTAFCAVLACAASLRADDPKPCNSPPASAVGAEGWISLFNGKDLTGWKLGDEKQSKIHVEDGKLVCAGPRSHAFTEWEFKNFEFEADVMTTPGSNSGIYFHARYQQEGFPNTGFETQVDCSHGDPVRTGSLYNLVKLYETPAKDDEWWRQTIIVQGKNVKVKINGKLVIDYTEPAGVSPGRNKLDCGSFALQAHDPNSVTYYRNLRVKQLSETPERPRRRRRP
jgi:hypothetical protein